MLPYLRTSNVLESVHVSCITYLAVDVTSGRRCFPAPQKERVVVRPRRRDVGVWRGKNTARRAMRVPDGPVYHIRDTLKQ
jgi:hypothetical protein